MYLFSSLKSMLTPAHARKNRHNMSNMITISGAGLRLDLEERQQTRAFCGFVPVSMCLCE